MAGTKSTSATSPLPVWHNRTSAEAIELLRTRRSLPNEFHRDPGPSPEELETILRCAIRVPDHARLSPWRIHVLQGEARYKLGAVLAELFAQENPGASAAQIEAERVRLGRSPLVLVVSTCVTSDRIRPIEQILSGAAVCQNILIAATALGYAAQWLTDWPAYHSGVKAALGVAESDQILGYLYIGTAGAAPQERPRPNLEDIVTVWE